MNMFVMTVRVTNVKNINRKILLIMLSYQYLLIECSSIGREIMYFRINPHGIMTFDIISLLINTIVCLKFIASLSYRDYKYRHFAYILLNPFSKKVTIKKKVDILQFFGGLECHFKNIVFFFFVNTYRPTNLSISRNTLVLNTYLAKALLKQSQELTFSSKDMG